MSFLDDVLDDSEPELAELPEHMASSLHVRHGVIRRAPGAAAPLAAFAVAVDRVAPGAAKEPTDAVALDDDPITRQED